MAKPQPISNHIVCSECGRPWSDHKKKTLEECVRLLKAELAKRPVFQSIGGTGFGPRWYNANSPNISSAA